jgi:hypothetical protein
LKIRGMSISGNLLMGVNRLGHCLTLDYHIVHLVILDIGERRPS